MAGAALGYPLAIHGFTLENLILGLGMAVVMSLIGIVLVVGYEGVRYISPLE